jgi:hypothetical protein
MLVRRDSARRTGLHSRTGSVSADQLRGLLSGVSSCLTPDGDHNIAPSGRKRLVTLVARRKPRALDKTRASRFTAWLLLDPRLASQKHSDYLDLLLFGVPASGFAAWWRMPEVPLASGAGAGAGARSACGARGSEAGGAFLLCWHAVQRILAKRMPPHERGPLFHGIYSLNAQGSRCGLTQSLDYLASFPPGGFRLREAALLRQICQQVQKNTFKRDRFGVAISLRAAGLLLQASSGRRDRQASRHSLISVSRAAFTKLRRDASLRCLHSSQQASGAAA